MADEQVILLVAKEVSGLGARYLAASHHKKRSFFCI